jgi:prepilin-type N-terminal cleavage/methylation domain-containing protein
MYAKPNTVHGMHGFTLIEMAISLTLLAGVTLFALQWQSFFSKVDQGKSAGQQYVAMNTALNNYMVTHAKALSLLKPACSETTFAYGISKATSAQRLAANCALVVEQKTMALNGLQPTTAELVALGFMPAAQTDIPLLMTGGTPTPIAEATASGAASPRPAVARLFMNIEHVCLLRPSASGSASPSTPITPGDNGCPANTTTALKSLIFNTQPYHQNIRGNNFGLATKITTLTSTIGLDALWSDYSDLSQLDTNPTSPQLGDLWGKGFVGAQNQALIKNPIRYIDTKASLDIGVNGIIAIRGGYGAAYANQHTRVDGSNLPTSDWSFAGYSLADVKNLTVQNQVNAKTANVDQLKLAVRTPNTACDASVESMAISTLNSAVVVCRQGVWAHALAGTVNAQEYYELSFTDDAQGAVALSFVYCTKNVCTPVTNIGTYKGQGPAVISTTLSQSSWFPVVMGVSQKGTAGATALPRAGVSIKPSSDLFQISFDYRDRQDISSLTVRFYRINA